MASNQAPETEIDVLKDILIVQLLLAGYSARDVRQIAKCGMNRVSAISKVLNKKGKST